MLRVLFYLVIVAALGFGFAWLADRPGELDVTFAGNHYNVPLITAVAGSLPSSRQSSSCGGWSRASYSPLTRCAVIFVHASETGAINRFPPD